MFYVPRFQAAQLAKRVKVPEELILKPLDKSYGKEVFENYPHREEEREGTFELLIEMNPSMGLFSKENGELLAWCLRYIRFSKLPKISVKVPKLLDLKTAAARCFKCLKSIEERDTQRMF